MTVVFHKAFGSFQTTNIAGIDAILETKAHLLLTDEIHMVSGICFKIMGVGVRYIANKTGPELVIVQVDDGYVGVHCTVLLLCVLEIF